MELTRTNITGDFNFTGTFLTDFSSIPGVSTNTSFSIIQEDNAIKIIFTFRDEVNKTCTKLYVNPIHRTDFGDKNKSTYDCEMFVFRIDEDATIRFYGNRPFSFFSEDILVDIDPYLITHDEAYFECLMKDVLNVERVRRYLNEGAKESPSTPCGNYVGGATYYNSEDGKPKKGFNPEVGWHAQLLYQDTLFERKKESLKYKIGSLNSKNDALNEEAENLKRKLEKIYQQVQANNIVIAEAERELAELTQNIQVPQQEGGHISM